jgi:hypothetical protein
MNTKAITREKLSTIFELSEKLDKATEHASELLRTAQDRFNEAEETFEREGQQVTVKRSVLWQEVFYLGHNCEAAEILKKNHQDVFDAYLEQGKIADQLRDFCVTELSVDYTKMKLSDYLKLVEEMIDLKASEQK